jgi:hypothetical protein
MRTSLGETCVIQGVDEVSHCSSLPRKRERVVIAFRAKISLCSCEVERKNNVPNATFKKKKHLLNIYLEKIIKVSPHMVLLFLVILVYSWGFLFMNKWNILIPLKAKSCYIDLNLCGRKNYRNWSWNSVQKGQPLWYQTFHHHLSQFDNASWKNVVNQG